MQDRPDVIVWPPLLLAVAVAGILLFGWLWSLPVSSHPAALWFGVALFLAGTALSVWGSHSMSKAGTNISAMQPATVLVTSGPFRFTRNPLYVADTFLLLGLSLVLNNAWGILAVVLLSVIRHYGVILREERYLEAKFGESYRQYCSAVRRYF